MRANARQSLLVVALILPQAAWCDAPQRPASRLGLPPVTWVEDGPKALLGERLFSDPRLSADGRVSCASCHARSIAFSDGRRSSVGVNGRTGTRNAPSLLNSAFQRFLFWDGRADTLESQARMPLLNPVEHGLRDTAQLVEIVRAERFYRDGFAETFGGSQPITIENVSTALAAFQRRMLSGGSAFDRYYYGSEEDALTPSAMAGLNLFLGKARCAGCHSIGKKHALFTDHEFHMTPLGIPDAVSRKLASITSRIFRATDEHSLAQLEELIASDAELSALGRFVVTALPSDIGKFKTPPLRNVALTAPYMHNGSVATLEQAVELELYRRDTAIAIPIVLTPVEKRSLVAFLEALTGPQAAADVDR
jgi:cytochrome c peroxidase